MSTETFSRIIKKNEQEANRVVAKTMLITFGVFTLVYILNLVGVFVVDALLMNIAYFIGSASLIVPSLINHFHKTESRKLKYIYVSLAALFLMVIVSILTYHSVVFYVFPIAIGGLYFSKQVTRFASIATFIVTVCGQYIGYFIGVVDKNAPNLYALTIYNVLPRSLIIMALAALLELMTNRTSALLKEDAKNYEHQAKYSRSMIYGFATLVENRDENTGGHIRRTSIYAELLAAKLKEKGIYSDIITDEFIKSLAMVAPLHDIGKIAIPDSILCKPGKLTDEEFDIMKSHSARGGEIIKETFSEISGEDYGEMAYEVARYHHEKWNGRGYPEGLSGENIPLSARIMTVADVFDAVSEKRCYRDAMSIDKCFEIISDGIGRDFDPVIAKTFLEMRETITEIRNRDKATEE